jgi:hypothetical protein
MSGWSQLRLGLVQQFVKLSGCRKSEGPDNFGKPRAFWVAVLEVSAAAM